MFSALLCLPENSITVNVVVPLVPKPFLNTRELYDNNYTFVVQTKSYEKSYEWLINEYSTKNHPRVIGIAGFWFYDVWLERYFLKHQSSTKYAMVGVFLKTFQFPAVNFLREKNDTCYQMYPSEKELHPKAFFFGFTSAIGTSVNKGHSLVQALGFPQLAEAAQDFRLHLLALSYTRQLLAKYDKEINHVDLKHKRLKENLITSGNMKTVYYVGLIVIVCSCICFAAEVFSKVIVFMMLTKVETL